MCGFDCSPAPAVERRPGPSEAIWRHDPAGMHSSRGSERMRTRRMLRYSNPGASACLFPSLYHGGQGGMNNGQGRLAIAESDIDLAARRYVVWNKVKHFL